jgi:hypothetical protein
MRQHDRHDGTRVVEARGRQALHREKCFSAIIERNQMVHSMGLKRGFIVGEP